MELDFEGIVQTITFYLTEFGLKAVGALVFLVVGRIVAGGVRKATGQALTRSGTDTTLIPFISGLVYAALMAGIFIAAAGMVGIEAGSFIAIIGAAGLAIALAFQGTLSNFSAGIMLLTFRPFKVGDFVEAAGISGTIKEIAVFTTILATPDNVRIIVPNSSIAGSTIKNFSANETRRIDLVVGVHYEDDLNVAMSTINDILKADARVLEDPAPVVAVSEMADSSMNFVVRPWVKSADYWQTRWDLTKQLKEGLEAAGCSIPYPQRDVHMFQASAD